MNVYQRLLAIQQKLKSGKGLYNSFGKYKYRSCESILESLKPLLAENECVILLSDELVVKESETAPQARFYVKATASLVYSGDEAGRIDVTAFAREEEMKKGMDGSQITGAASSYARKYALNGLFAIDDTKDSDATNKYEPSEKPEEDSLPEKPKKDVRKLLAEILAENGISQESCLSFLRGNNPWKKVYIDVDVNFDGIPEDVADKLCANPTIINQK